MKRSCTLNCRGIYSAFPAAKLQIPAASQLSWHCQHSLCALPASGPPRTLFLVVKKGILFVLNPSSLLWAKQNREDSWGKDLGKVLSYTGRAWPCSQLYRIPPALRDGSETHCAIRLHQHLSSPAVFSWQINRAPQGSSPSSQGRSTWPLALWVSGLSGCQTADWRSFTRSAGELTCCHCLPSPGRLGEDDPPAWLWKCTGTFKKW